MPRELLVYIFGGHKPRDLLLVIFLRRLHPSMYSGEYDVIYGFLCLFVSYGSFFQKMYLHVYVYVLSYVFKMPI
jgi:hypothetical protein